MSTPTSTQVEAPTSEPSPSPSEAAAGSEAVEAAPSDTTEASATAGTADAAPAETAGKEEVLPAPAGPLRSQPERPSFWRRIKMRRRDRVFVDGSSQEAMSARMTELEQHLEKAEETLLAQLQHVEQRLDEVWEIEEQLSHLVEIGQKLDGLVEGQKALREANERQEMSIRLVAAFAGVLSIVILAAVALSL